LGDYKVIQYIINWMDISADILIGRRKGGYKIRNVKMLTLAQLITMIVVFAVVFIYNSLRPAMSHRVYGTVEGVLYSADESSVLIDGQIVREGEHIYGVRVIRIHRNKVDFEAGGKKWEQRVRERPNPAWGEPNQPQLHTDTNN